MKYKIYVLASTEFGWPQNAPHQNSTIMGTPQTPLGFFYKNQQEIYERRICKWMMYLRKLRKGWYWSVKGCKEKEIRRDSSGWSKESGDWC